MKSAVVDLHPSLRVARAFDDALTKASREPASSVFGCGALSAIYVIAEAAGLSNDPRVAALYQRIAESPRPPREGERAA